MARISKNIKQFRSEKKLTQEQLAEKINVSRQTVSSWETDRTQPDIDMLETLSGVFEVSVEELIYGKKNKVGLEPDKKSDRKIFVLILTIFGSLFLAVGLAILFCVFWEKISMAKNIFAMLPLFAGFGLSFFVLTKKKDSLPWREASSLLWTVGLCTTVALVNSLNSIDFGFFPLMLLDTVLILPILLVTEGTFPFITFNIGLVAAPFGLAFSKEADIFRYTAAAAFVLLFAVALLFYIKRKTGDIRDAIRLWCIVLSLGAGLVFTAVLPVIEGDAFFIGAYALFCYLIFLVSMGDRFTKYPIRNISAALISLFTVSEMFLISNCWLDFNRLSEWIVTAVIVLVTAVIIGINFRKLLKNPVFAVLAGCLIAQNVLLGVFGESLAEDGMFAGAIPAAGAAVAVIVAGITGSKLSVANFGMLEAVAVIAGLLVFCGADLFVTGIIITLTGIALLAVNAVLIKKFKKEAEINRKAEEQKNA